MLAGWLAGWLAGCNERPCCCVAGSSRPHEPEPGCDRIEPGYLVRGVAKDGQGSQGPPGPWEAGHPYPSRPRSRDPISPIPGSLTPRIPGSDHPIPGSENPRSRDPISPIPGSETPRSRDPISPIPGSACHGDEATRGIRVDSGGSEGPGLARVTRRCLNQGVWLGLAAWDGWNRVR